LVKRELVQARLERLREYLQVLKFIKKRGLQRFRDDPLVRGAAERYLHLSIECVIDVGNHIISDRRYRKPETYAEIFEILFEKGVLPEKLFHELRGMAGFRNVLVHDYVRLDAEKVFGFIQSKLKYIEELAAVYSELV
jgi:uncharacterized protein YutE (UPF0331/DUF86 family)